MLARITDLALLAMVLGAYASGCGPRDKTQVVATEAGAASSFALSTRSANRAPTSSSPLAVSAAPIASASAPSQAPRDGSLDLCPAEMAFVEGEHCFYFDQYCERWDDPEGHPAKRVCAKFQKPSKCTQRRHHLRYCIDRDEYIAAGERLASVNVTWENASKTCKGLGKRLCSSQEWEFACEGEEGVPYPYGYERAPSLCNQDRILRDGKHTPTADLREPPHATCASPFGVRDMVGNVDEWVHRRFARAPRRSELRGGWWMTGRNRCRANTGSHDEKYSGHQTGFRCCKEAAGGSTKK